MRIVTQTFWLPKKGNSSEEYEDSAAPMEPVECETDSFRCAVADGATETSFSGFWAKLLVDGYVNNQDRSSLKPLWAESLANKQLAWYAEQKAESGAFAALVGLTIKDTGSKSGGTWEAEAVGDCCLVQVRDGKIIERFPLTSSEEFNSSPYLLSSNFEEEEASKMFVTKSGSWKYGDIFYLLSDAIARWAFKREEDHSDSANWLNGIKLQEQIDEFCDIQRTLTDSESRPLMRNDDVTFLRVKLSK